MWYVSQQAIKDREYLGLTFMSGLMLFNCLPLPTPCLAPTHPACDPATPSDMTDRSLNMTVFLLLLASHGLYPLIVLFQFPWWIHDCPLRSNSSVTSSMKSSLTVPGRISHPSLCVPIALHSHRYYNKHLDVPAVQIKSRSERTRGWDCLRSFFVATPGLSA